MPAPHIELAHKLRFVNNIDEPDASAVQVDCTLSYFNQVLKFRQGGHKVDRPLVTEFATQNACIFKTRPPC